MTAVNSINWYKFLGASGTIVDNTTKTVYVGVLLSFYIETIPQIYHFNISGCDCRIVGTDDVIVSSNTAASTTIGLGVNAGS